MSLLIPVCLFKYCNPELIPAEQTKLIISASPNISPFMEGENLSLGALTLIPLIFKSQFRYSATEASQRQPPHSCSQNKSIHCLLHSEVLCTPAVSVVWRLSPCADWETLSRTNYKQYFWESNCSLTLRLATSSSISLLQECRDRSKHKPYTNKINIKTHLWW